MMAEANQKEKRAEADWFISKKISPPKITRVDNAFDSKAHMFELMRDGIRCIAYLDEKATDLRSTRNMRLLPLFPELSNLHLAAMKPCAIDGFIVYEEENEWDSIQSRMYTTLPHEIQKAAAIHPAKMIAHDILCCDGIDMTRRKYQQRRLILRDNLNDIRNLSISHAIEELGVAFYTLAEENGWDGILAKRKDGLYHTGKSPSDWLYIPVPRESDE